VSSLPVLPVVPGTLRARDIEALRPQTQPSNVKDPAVQKSHGPKKMPAPLVNFDGICLPFGPQCDLPSSCSCLPPDTNGEVGRTQYVQMVNTDFAVFSKTGQVLRGATPINQLWAGTNGECATHNEGDPVVVYDQLADRWLLSQFIAQPAAGEQYGECIAVSQTGDATGAYYRYEFNETTSVSKGAGAFVFERSKMLTGQPARFVFFDESLHNPPGFQYIGQLPTDLDGKKAPAAGEPNVFVEVDDPSGIPPTKPGDLGFTLRTWKFHVDWANPANSTFGNDGAPSADVPVAPFVRPQCVYGYGPNCEPQKGGPQGLDTLGDRLMFRAAYRNFGGHESLVINHTVVADARNGVRWYEIRSPAGSPTIYQQGTYAPSDGAGNPLWRWMASAAQDGSGDLAVGFSASGPNEYPSLRYAGRLAGDPLGELTQDEQVLYTGTGPQTEAEGRWGDYSDLTVDPVDDCTFWYTTEYLAVDTVVIGTWRTRIASFRFPGCK
jgi:hypothetical protein